MELAAYHDSQFVTCVARFVMYLRNQWSLTMQLNYNCTIEKELIKILSYCKMQCNVLRMPGVDLDDQSESNSGQLVCVL